MQQIGTRKNQSVREAGLPPIASQLKKRGCSTEGGGLDVIVRVSQMQRERGRCNEYLKITLFDRSPGKEEAVWIESSDQQQTLVVIEENTVQKIELLSKLKEVVSGTHPNV